MGKEVKQVVYASGIHELALTCHSLGASYTAKSRMYTGGRAESCQYIQKAIMA